VEGIDAVTKLEPDLVFVGEGREHVCATRFWKG